MESWIVNESIVKLCIYFFLVYFCESLVIVGLRSEILYVYILIFREKIVEIALSDLRLYEENEQNWMLCIPTTNRNSFAREQKQKKKSGKNFINGIQVDSGMSFVRFQKYHLNFLQRMKFAPTWHGTYDSLVSAEQKLEVWKIRGICDTPKTLYTKNYPHSKHWIEFEIKIEIEMVNIGCITGCPNAR